MHFHVVEKRHDGRRVNLGGTRASSYPCPDPVFATAALAVRAVAHAAGGSWGPRVAGIVDSELWRELHRDPLRPQQAIVMWRQPGQSGDGALWTVRSCECVDGTLAELLDAGPALT